MTAGEHEHAVSVIRSGGGTEWEFCSCGVKRRAGGPWFVPPPRAATATYEKRPGSEQPRQHGGN